MTGERTANLPRVLGILGIAVLTAMAVFCTRVGPAGSISSLASGSDATDRVTRTLLPDGRTFEVHGEQGWAEIVDEGSRRRIQLPEARRLGSVTVMPAGDVLLWGGMDPQGHLLTIGEWFDPATERFVRTRNMRLEPRAGHTMTVLTDGRLLMQGGWTANGVPAREAVVWDPVSRATTLVIAEVINAVDRPAKLRATTTADAALRVVSTWPASEADDVPLHGPLAIRFNRPVDVRQLSAKTVTLLGPEGAVPIRVVGAEDGRLAFVQLPDDLYPGSRYTLFVQGVHDRNGESVPYTAVGFTTLRLTAGVAVAGRGQMRDGASLAATKDAAGLPPLYLMAGDKASAAPCRSHDPHQLCRAQSFVQDGAWYPGQNNAPDATGAHWRLYRPHQTLPDAQAIEAHLPKGTTALLGQVRQIDEKPVAGVEVSIGGIKARTDARGLFVLAGLPAGRQELFVDGRPAGHGGKEYGRFLVGADLKAGTVNRMPFVMYLPRVLPRDKVTLPSPTTREVVLTHPDMPGLELHIPAGTVFRDREGHVLTQLAIVPTPVDHAPFPLPDNFPMYFTIQPGDAVVQALSPEVARGIRVVYPNYGREKPRTPADFWVYDVKAGWRMYGAGHVTADAGHVAPDPGVALVWALGAGASINNAAPPNGRACNGESRSQPVDLQTGIFFHEWTDLAIRDVLPLALTRAYRSDDSASHAFGTGGSSNFGIHLYSTDGFTTPQLVMPCGEGIPFHLVSGAATWPFSADTIWEHTSTNSAFYGATLQFLFDNTGDGAHWILTFKDGTQYAFTRHVPNALSWIQDRFGNQIQLVYNGGLLEQAISPSGRYITFDYDGSNRIIRATDNTGRSLTYAYGSNGALSMVAYPDQTTEQYTYDDSKRLLTMQDRRGTVWVSNQYDANGRVVKQTLADQASYQFAYAQDANGAVTATTVTDPNGHQERLTFDPASHYPLTDTYAYGTPLAQTTTYVRKPSGLVDSVTDALGRRTSFTYDALGNITQVTRLAGTADAASYSFTYTDDYSLLASTTDPLGHTTHFDYTNGCLTRITDPLGHSTTIACNGSGQTTAVTDPLGHTATLAYQGYDLQTATDPLGRTTTYTTDALGRPVAVRDPLGNVVLALYDSNDRVVETIDGLNQSMAASYDGNGNLLGVTLPNGGAIQYAYDVRNRVTQRTDALGQSESWAYDGQGNVLSHTDRKGQVTQYSYDALDRRTLTSYADGSGTQASYDAGNRLTELLDTQSGSLSWGYDGLDRITQAVTPQGTVSYGYDVAGRRTRMTVAAQADVTYSYDSANRLTSLTQGTETVQFGYDAANRRSTLTLPNGIEATYSYDAANRLTGIAYRQGSGTALGDLAYGYDTAGRLVGKTGSLATDLLPQATTQAATFDLNNRLTSFNGTAYTYDANGNLTGDGANTYTWNARNQLVRIGQNGTPQLSYSYDALGRRISKQVGGGTPTQYLYDGLDIVQETQGGTVNPILTGLGIDERYARNDVIGRTYFLTDALGSTLALTNGNGEVKQRYSYDPYGNVSESDPGTGFTNPYQYTGREADAPGLYYYRARYYSPVIGGFISEDPAGFLGGQASFYAYAGGNPVGYIDPLGLWVPPALPQGLADFATGVADAASFDIGPRVREAFGIDGGINRCSTAYKAGEWASLGLGVGRMLYAGVAKIGAVAAADGLGAMAFRNGLKRVMRGPLAGSSFRIKNYSDLLEKYGTDEAIKAAAGRTNPLANAVGADMATGGVVDASTCGCH